MIVVLFAAVAVAVAIVAVAAFITAVTVATVTITIAVAVATAIVVAPPDVNTVAAPTAATSAALCGGVGGRVCTIHVHIYDHM